MSSSDKLKIGDVTLTNVLNEANKNYVNNITSSGNKITVSKKDGTSTTIPITNALTDITTAGNIGPTVDVSFNLSGQNNINLLVPHITFDSKGRITSMANRTITVK